jgi:hypothetical protein
MRDLHVLASTEVAALAILPIGELLTFDLKGRRFEIVLQVESSNVQTSRGDPNEKLETWEEASGSGKRSLYVGAHNVASTLVST